MKYNMVIGPEVPPVEDGLQDGINFFELNVTIPKFARNTGREPMRAKDPSESLASTCICINMDSRLSGLNQSNTIPHESECPPPQNISSGISWDVVRCKR